MVTRDTGRGLALFVGGIAALSFSMALVLFARWLNGDRVVLTEPWRMMEQGERPAGPGGRQLACNCLRETALRFAKVSSAVAATLLGCALLIGSE